VAFPQTFSWDKKTNWCIQIRLRATDIQGKEVILGYRTNMIGNSKYYPDDNNKDSASVTSVNRVVYYTNDETFYLISAGRIAFHTKDTMLAMKTILETFLNCPKKLVLKYLDKVYKIKNKYEHN
jgi:hypothetical protein